MHQTIPKNIMISLKTLWYDQTISWCVRDISNICWHFRIFDHGPTYRKILEITKNIMIFSEVFGDTRKCNELSNKISWSFWKISWYVQDSVKIPRNVRTYMKKWKKYHHIFWQLHEMFGKYRDMFWQYHDICGCTLSTFFQRPRVRTRHLKWELEWSLGHLKSQKVWKSEHSKKHEKSIQQKTKINSICASKWNSSFVGETPPKSQQSSKSSINKMVRRAHLERPKSQKIVILTSRKTAKAIANDSFFALLFSALLDNMS